MLAPKFKPGDKFKLSYKDLIGTVERLRDNQHERQNSWPMGFYHYSVTFEDGSFETYLSETDMIPIYLSSPSINTDPFVLVSTDGTVCKFKKGDRIIVTKETLMFDNPLKLQFVEMKRGVIDEVGPRSQYTNPPFICIYNLLFDDGTKAVEVPESKIKTSIPVQYDNSINQLLNPVTMNDLVLINNINQIVSKNKVLPVLQTMYETSYEYQDINEDKKLQNDVIIFYHNKTLKWLDKNEEFKKLKKHLKFIKSKKGLTYIKTVLKLYIKKHNAKWYELRGEDNYDSVKEFIRKNLSTI